MLSAKNLAIGPVSSLAFRLCISLLRHAAIVLHYAQYLSTHWSSSSPWTMRTVVAPDGLLCGLTSLDSLVMLDPSQVCRYMQHSRLGGCCIHQCSHDSILSCLGVLVVPATGSDACRLRVCRLVASPDLSGPAPLRHQKQELPGSSDGRHARARWHVHVLRCCASMASASMGKMDKMGD